MIALFRTEFIKASRRTRTLIILAGLVVLPAFITFAIHNRARRAAPEAGEGLFRLARLSGLVVPAALLAVMSAFLLVVVAGTFAGDAVAGDAATGNLRYLLIRPVKRARLLVAKAAVSGVLIWVATLLVVLTGLVAGVVLFGWHPITVPGLPATLGGSGTAGFTLSIGVLLERLVIATAYVAFGFTALLAMGTFFSTLTDTPAGAIGITIGVWIVSEIMDGITDLGTIRYALPTHYSDAWQSLFVSNQFSHDLIAGIVVQMIYFVVFGALALWWFGRKDIRS
jgi:ABC-2 type transport system permease protein